MFYILPILFTIILLTIVITILYWLNKFEENKCTCAINNERYKEIKYYWYFLLIMYIITLLYNILIYSTYITELIISNDLLGIFVIFFIFVSIWHIYNSYNTYKYVNEIDKSNCTCANKSKKLNIIYIYSIFLGILGLITLIFLIPFLVVYIKSCGFINNKTDKCINFLNNIRNKYKK